MAVATDTEGFGTLGELVPELVGHALALFLGMVFIGIGQRMKKSAA